MRCIIMLSGYINFSISYPFTDRKSVLFLLNLAFQSHVYFTPILFCLFVFVLKDKHIKLKKQTEEEAIIYSEIWLDSKQG